MTTFQVKAKKAPKYKLILHLYPSLIQPISDQVKSSHSNENCEAGEEDQPPGLDVWREALSMLPQVTTSPGTPMPEGQCPFTRMALATVKAWPLPQVPRVRQHMAPDDLPAGVSQCPARLPRNQRCVFAGFPPASAVQCRSSR